MSYMRDCPACTGTGDCPACDGGLVDCECATCGHLHDHECRECSGDGECQDCDTGEVPVSERDLEAAGQLSILGDVGA